MAAGRVLPKQPVEKTSHQSVEWPKHRITSAASSPGVLDNTDLVSLVPGDPYNSPAGSPIEAPQLLLKDPPCTPLASIPVETVPYLPMVPYTASVPPTPFDTEFWAHWDSQMLQQLGCNQSPVHEYLPWEENSRGYKPNSEPEAGTDFSYDQDMGSQIWMTQADNGTKNVRRES